MTVHSGPGSHFANRVRFTDMDGSGTIDAVYGDGSGWWCVDLLSTGSGTPVRPRLLVGVENGLGAETSIAYESAAVDYLRDLAEARACGTSCESFTWARIEGEPSRRLARLSDEPDANLYRAGGTPVLSTVVRSVRTTDRMSVFGREEQVSESRFSYHDGYYEGIEQEFRGFGAADAVVVGDVRNGRDESVLTRTWFHQGRRPSDIADDRLAWSEDEALKGREYLTEVFDRQGTFLTTSHASLTTRLGAVVDLRAWVLRMRAAPGRRGCEHRPLDVSSLVPHECAPPVSARRIHFISLGCPKNRVDTEVMLGVSGLTGYRAVEDASEADVVVVNTCGFIGPAKEESIDTILRMSQLKEEGSLQTLVVAGCLSQRYSAELAVEMPEVDHFLGSSDMLKLGEVLERPGVAPRMLVGNPADWTLRATDPRLPSLSRHSVYVKIAEGCNRSCAFCAIPSFRGKQRSRPVDDVVAECERLVSEGAVELNLISQDTIAFGRDRKDGSDLATLVRRVADVKGVRWVRVFYLYPETIKPELTELFAGHPRVLPYVDMPLQHASDRMLKIMKRGHGIDRQRRVVETLRAKIPDLVFRSAFIVGHPGETDADFDELVRFVEWAELDRIGVFTYSHEEETSAFALADDVADKTKRARSKKLHAVQRAITRKKTKALVGREVEVLVEGVSGESEFLLEGRWWGQAPEVDGKVYLANGTAERGELRRALITSAAEHDLVADLADEAGQLPEPPPGAKRVRRKEPLRLRTL